VWKMLILISGWCRAGFINRICVIADVRRQRLDLSIDGTAQIPPEDWDRIQSSKRCVLNKRQDDG
jgi:hypothetical protein